MKNRINKVNNIVRLVALVLAIIAFFMLFLPQIAYINPFGGTKEVIPLYYQQVFFGNGKFYNGTLVPLFGYIMVLISALIIVICSFIIKKENFIIKVLIFVCSLVIIAGSILIVSSKLLFLGANPKLTRDASYSLDYLLAGPIAGGILGLISGFCNLASVFIDEKKEIIKNEKSISH